MEDLKHVEGSEADVNSMSPERAAEEIIRITNDKNHAFWNESIPMARREAAISYVRRLYEIRAGLKTSISGYVSDVEKERKEQVKVLSGMETGSGDIEGRSSSNGRPYNPDSENGGMPGLPGIDVNRKFSVPVAAPVK